MVTVKLLIAGLALFVPHQTPGTATVLLPDTRQWPGSVYPIPPHVAELGFLESDLAEGKTCGTYSGIGAVPVAGQGGVRYCFIPLASRELELGATATAPLDRAYLGDVVDIGPALASTVDAAG
jgi:hypothetical protein